MKTEVKFEGPPDMLVEVLKGFCETNQLVYNLALEDAKKAVVAEYLRLKDAGRQEQFDIADIATPIDGLKK